MKAGESLLLIESKRLLPWSNIEPAAKRVAQAEVLNTLEEPFGRRGPSDRSLTILKTFL